MKQIMEFFRSLFGVEHTVEKITRPITSIVAKLDEYQSAQEERAARERAVAEEKLAKAASADKAAAQAAATRQKFSSIFAE